jgi:hypothetical protein
LNQPSILLQLFTTAFHSTWLDKKIEHSYALYLIQSLKISKMFLCMHIVSCAYIKILCLSMKFSLPSDCSKYFINTMSFFSLLKSWTENKLALFSKTTGRTSDDEIKGFQYDEKQNAEVSNTTGNVEVKPKVRTIQLFSFNMNSWLQIWGDMDRHHLLSFRVLSCASKHHSYSTQQ